MTTRHRVPLPDDERTSPARSADEALLDVVLGRTAGDANPADARDEDAS